MIAYAKNEPLIAIHIPKSAGTSVRRVFKEWFYPSSFFLHYYDEEKGRPPHHVDLRSLARRPGRLWGSVLRRPDRPICIYGHFPRARGFGIEERFPEVRQFVAILLDPFETALSTYHYLRKAGETWQDQSRIPKTELREYLMDTPSRTLDHFPREITAENYKEIIGQYFIDIGITEKLEESLTRIASKLGKRFDPSRLPQLNVTERSDVASGDLREVHRERNPLEYLVYEYVRNTID
jgi:hypothetical protein